MYVQIRWIYSLAIILFNLTWFIDKFQPSAPGSKLSCTRCQASNHPYAQYCGSCGTIIEPPQRPEVRNSGITVTLNQSVSTAALYIKDIFSDVEGRSGQSIFHRIWLNQVKAITTVHCNCSIELWKKFYESSHQIQASTQYWMN